MTVTQEQRITDLESETFRIGNRLDRFASSIEHLTNAVGDLSQEQRGLTFDVREIKSTLTDHGTRLERIEHTVTGIEQTITGIEQTITGNGDLLRAILDRLGGDSRPTDTPHA